ncbi:unnamed protein product [Effrenium voratum]|nr:unnamed protein product [Effrenium voratum]
MCDGGAPPFGGFEQHIDRANGTPVRSGPAGAARGLGGVAGFGMRWAKPQARARGGFGVLGRSPGAIGLQNRFTPSSSSIPKTFASNWTATAPEEAGAPASPFERAEKLAAPVTSLSVAQVWLERPRRQPGGVFSFDLKVRVHSGFEEEDPEDPLVRLLRQPALCEIASPSLEFWAVWAPGEVFDGRLTPARALGRALRDAAELEALLQQAKRPAVQQELQKLLKQFQAAAEKPPAPEPAEPKAAEPKAAEPKAELRPTGPWEEITTFALDLGGMNSDIVVDVRLKGVEALPQENVTCDFKPDSFDLKVLNLEGHNYRFLRTNLEKDIVPGESSIRVKKNHVLVTLRKVKEKYGYESWMDLCAKGKRRSAAKDTTDPQDGLMSMMKDLYEDGDDNMKKIIGEAMYKARSGQSDPKDMTNLDNMEL